MLFRNNPFWPQDSGYFKGGSPPKPKPPPPPPPTPSRTEAATVLDAIYRKKPAGLASTVLTGPMAEEQQLRKTYLGQ